MTPSSTLIRSSWPSRSEARLIQQPRRSQTAVTTPAMRTVLPTNRAGRARSSEIFVVSLPVSGAP
jgi:hypothetical protein